MIKLGGRAMEERRAETLLDIVLLRYVGMCPVVVHGGGPEITAMSERLGLKPRFKDGLRVTDAETMEVVKMVLAGKINPELVATLNRLGARAIGMSGEDGPTVIAEGADPELGFVGRVTQVDTQPLEALISRGYIPVLASVGLGYDGNSYNINADTAAAEVAVALGATKLILLTDVPGVLKPGGEVASELCRADAEAMIVRGEVSDGMIPKLKACVRSLDAVPLAHIIDGRLGHALLLELFTESGVGTMVMP